MNFDVASVDNMYRLVNSYGAFYTSISCLLKQWHVGGHCARPDGIPGGVFRGTHQGLQELFLFTSPLNTTCLNYQIIVRKFNFFKMEPVLAPLNNIYLFIYFFKYSPNLIFKSCVILSYNNSIKETKCILSIGSLYCKCIQLVLPHQ